MAHTPGPWTYDETTLSICRGIVSVEDVQAFRVSPEANASLAIAYVPCDVNREAQEANAKLLMAAPDLLAALNDLLSRYTELVNCGDCGNWDPETEEPVIDARAAIAKAEATHAAPA